ncbi:penicillin acylase family protein [Aeoliella sp. ICT_H6.2]|uniref:Penicillin acylase family protein n=1 Tax=Aeoliella straminimaris TaxID=2954799 RepID=A0A9X2FFZ5_9BACT|nr:penicillin acylase family protein [Aeoliella straminimaris]MCO6047573.1 penicillin acylase family protein [Aeoliella straminimaris]
MAKSTAVLFPLFIVAICATCRAEPVEILRDPWGVPHVFAATDAGAMYGLGYATAEDRGFQMTYSLRIIQGRLSEVVGEVRKLRRDETSIDHDKKMRTFGFHRAAQQTAENLDAGTKALLDAYCRGVNDYFAEHSGDLNPMFAEVGLEAEQWTPADCLASWWHIAQFFATDGTRDLMASRGMNRRARELFMQVPEGLKQMPPDETPAVVQRSDVTDEWVEQVNRYAQEHGMTSSGEAQEGPKFSHAWVVGGDMTTTGSSVLVSDPQTPVRNPSLFYEWHIVGDTFNARGIGVPGSPIILIGFTDRVAWGMTALGADQADLFLLETDEEHPDAYRFDGEWRDMQVYHESIAVKGAQPVELLVRETHLGPVATQYCFAQPRDGEVALKRIPICETDRDTIQGAIAMMRAGDATEFDDALAGWRFPSANVVFGDRDGDIGYRALGAMPSRSRDDPSHGRHARAARSSSDDWQEIVPHALQSHVMNPAAGFLYSGNHRTTGSWYSIPIGAMTGTGGDTVRSWRLRERLQEREKFTPGQVKAIHFESTNPARRDIVALGLHIEQQDADALSLEAQLALALLKPWYEQGASSSLKKEGSAVALELNTFFRFVSTHLAQVYGGGESGLAYFLKTATGQIADNPEHQLSELEVDFIDQSLATAWLNCLERYGDDPTTWQDQARRAVTEQRLGYYESLDGFGSLAPEHDLRLPALEITDGGTIACQTAQSYTQWVPMDDPDQAESILPIGQSERIDNRLRTSTLDLWTERKLHPAPLSRDKVEALGVTRQKLEFE